MASAEIAVRLQPRSHRNELVGLRDGVLLARVTAAPVDGKANRALCRLVAQQLGVAPSRVELVRGARSRAKLLRVDGLGSSALQRALGDDRLS